MSGPTQAERALPPVLRFYKNVLLGDGCWEWRGMRRPTGHGRVMIDGRRVSAARVAYELFYGEPPEGTQLNHHCDNPPCVRPDHLYAGTQLENIADRDRRGRHAAHRQTHCKNGHPFDEQNTYIYRAGKSRHCRICGREAMRRMRKRRRD